MKIFLLLIAFFMMGCGKCDIPTAPQGLSGTPGTNGQNGHNSLIAMASGASGCSNGGITLLAGLDADDSGILDSSEVSSSAEVCNGTDGQDAPPTSFTPTGLIDPCGDAPGRYDEVFIKLANGSLVASFSDNMSGQNTRFSVLTAGTYQTTDGDNCVFTLDASGNITSENHHYN